MYVYTDDASTWKTFKRKFSGDKGESWTKHLDSLETEVFEANSLVPKQCYYAIRKTLTGYSLKTLVAMERGTEKPAWPKCVPSWYKPSNDDLTKMLHAHQFVTFSYPLRIALMVVYFHRKFQKGSAKRALDIFNDSVQRPDETLQQWDQRIEEYDLDIK